MCSYREERPGNCSICKKTSQCPKICLRMLDRNQKLDFMLIIDLTFILFSAVIFEHSESTMPKFVNYKIRLSHQLQSTSINSKRGSWQTLRSYPFFKGPGPRSLDNP